MSGACAPVPLRELGPALQIHSARSSLDGRENDQLYRTSQHSSRYGLLPGSDHVPISATSTSNAFNSASSPALSAPESAQQLPATPPFVSALAQQAAQRAYTGRRTLYPIYEVPRYTNCPKVAPGHERYVIKPVATDFSLVMPPECYGWTAYTHPQGRLYFYSSDLTKNIYTDSDIRIHKVRVALHLFVDQLDGCDLVLYLRTTTSSNYDWCYYFADHHTHSLFWVEAFEFIPEVEEGDKIRPVNVPKHVEFYPDARGAPEQKEWTELSSALLLADLDVVTSPETTTVDYSPDKVLKRSALLDRAQVKDEEPAHAMIVLARLMSASMEFRWHNHHGQRTSETRILYATIVLTANISFLDLDGIPAFSHITSDISVVLSLMSILMGVVVQHYLGDKLGRASHVAQFGPGTRMMAAIYLSLPAALLYWSVNTFLMAFMGSIGGQPESALSSFIFIGIIAAFCTAMVYWSIFMIGFD
ncbi:hypothetical protein L226DRAFT_572367 [Lentinus tigrinus ALCF2SS1-7]|uniref:WW domain-containing protein n=1 Tax=Lentinus tigrinus ALCF2SS1-6 TaxID=1328759 RepID=A0A5C2S5H8_9APHY|nr:hypothetical protein L227DRAFT_612408 [Lentinus tigrinus ALCF2SS1-6]RPD73289.1 hypothetical protein L226DRAFT_572367 [Lentinus tigrinus ALCF2SS1-7]